jgi:hypothetical protein
MSGLPNRIELNHSEMSDSLGFWGALSSMATVAMTLSPAGKPAAKGQVATKKQSPSTSGRCPPAKKKNMEPASPRRLQSVLRSN